MEPGKESAETVGGTTVEELERFRRDIERYRARRKAVSDEFEGFVQTFKKPIATPPPPAAALPDRPEAASPPVRPPVAAPPAPPPVASPPVRPPVAALPVGPRIAAPPTAAAERRPVALDPAPASVPPTTSPDVAPSGRSASRVIPVLVLVALVAVVAVWLWPTDGGPAIDPVPQAARPAQEAPPATPPPVPPPAAAPDHDESVLTTTRPVWLRVIADGARVVNRELPAGARVPFKADKAIEIRTGDAGAVRLSIGGRDQGPLGRDGEVVTRSFTVPPR